MKNFTKKLLKVVLLIFILFSLFNINIKQYINQSVNYFNNNTQIKELNYNTLNDVFSTNLLEITNLVTNEWTIQSGISGGISIINSQLNVIGNAESNIFQQLQNLIVNNLYYASFNLISFGNVTGINFYLRGGTLEYIILNANTIGLNSGLIISNGTNTQLAFNFINLNGTAIIDNITFFNLTELKSNKQYSPLYQSTFDLMTEEEIKLTMDMFIEKPHLFIDYQNLYLINLNLTIEDIDYYYNLYLKNRRN